MLELMPSILFILAPMFAFAAAALWSVLVLAVTVRSVIARHLSGTATFPTVALAAPVLSAAAGAGFLSAVCLSMLTVGSFFQPEPGRFSDTDMLEATSALGVASSSIVLFLASLCITGLCLATALVRLHAMPRPSIAPVTVAGILLVGAVVVFISPSALPLMGLAFACAIAGPLDWRSRGLAATAGLLQATGSFVLLLPMTGMIVGAPGSTPPPPFFASVLAIALVLIGLPIAIPFVTGGLAQVEARMWAALRRTAA